MPAAVTRPPPSPTVSEIELPEDALIPEPGTGLLRDAGKGKSARARITYRLVASAFHDGTRMTPADAAYAYSFAYRWGGRAGGRAAADPAVETATAPLRQALVGFRVVKVEAEVKKFSDMTVHLHRAGHRRLRQRRRPRQRIPGRARAAMERRALARAGADGRGRQAGARGLFTGRGEAARRAVARPGAGCEDQGRARRAGGDVRGPGLHPARAQAARHGGRGADTLGLAQGLLRQARPLPRHQRALRAREVDGARSRAARRSATSPTRWESAPTIASRSRAAHSSPGLPPGATAWRSLPRSSASRSSCGTPAS